VKYEDSDDIPDQHQYAPRDYSNKVNDIPEADEDIFASNKDESSFAYGGDINSYMKPTQKKKRSNSRFSGNSSAKVSKPPSIMPSVPVSRQPSHRKGNMDSITFSSKSSESGQQVET
jgi:hypothetical protein